MTPQQRRRVEDIFEKVASAPQQDQTRLLNELAGDDPEVRAEVQSLLGGSMPTLDPEAESTRKIQAAFAPLGAVLADPLIGTRVGPYELIEKLGEGGMGAVYRARQSEPVKRDVAIKLIKPGMDSREVIQRFGAERQALAIMDHPNIARVLDASADERGRPYFVMEYVAGESITEYCDRHNLTTRARLELFAQVCDAIQHAHTKGIIHRDLKPSNVLVTIKDDKPVPKVIDFGVAKAIEQRLTERTAFTELGRIIGTPEYMSPEQAENTLLDIDTRTDIYSLGVLLYELLAGSLPFDPKTLRSAAYNEIQRIIREVDPPKPSARLSSQKGDVGSQIAERRRNTLPALASELRKELEWIPLKAMRKDRTERYRTAAEMAQDVRNYLAGRPLLAGPETISYKLRKFVRRNRSRVATAAVVAAIIVGTVVTAFVMISRSRDDAIAARDAEQRERIRAQQNFDLASRAVREFFVNVSQDQLLEQAGLSRLRGRLLDSAVRYYRQFSDQKLGDRAWRSELGQAHNVLGDFATQTGDVPGAIKSLEESLRIRRELAAENPTQTQEQLELAATMNNLARARLMSGDGAGGLTMQQEVVAVFQKLAAANANDLSLQLDQAQAISNLGTFQRHLGQGADAEASYKSALAKREAVAARPGPTADRAQRDVASTCTDLGLLYEAQNKPADAIGMYDRAVEARQTIVRRQPDNTQALVELAHATGLLAELQLKTGDPEGQNNLRRALKIWEDLLADPRHRGVSPLQSQAFTTAAWFHLILGETDAAVTTAQRGAEADPTSPVAQLNLAHALLFAGRIDAAQALYAKLAPVNFGGVTGADTMRSDFATLKKLNRTTPGMDIVAPVPTTRPQ